MFGDLVKAGTKAMGGARFGLLNVLPRAAVPRGPQQAEQRIGQQGQRPAPARADGGRAAEQPCRADGHDQQPEPDPHPVHGLPPMTWPEG